MSESTMHNFTERFGIWVRRHRTEANMSQEDLASRAGISKQYVSVLERAAPQHITGKSAVPSREVVEQIALALNQPPEIGWEMAGYSADAETYELLEGVDLVFRDANRLTSTQQQKLLDGCKLIAGGIINEEMGDWLQRVPQRISGVAGVRGR